MEVYGGGFGGRGYGVDGDRVWDRYDYPSVIFYFLFFSNHNNPTVILKRLFFKTLYIHIFFILPHISFSLTFLYFYLVSCYFKFLHSLSHFILSLSHFFI